MDNSNLPYSVKLKNAMDQIKKIMRENDITGMVLLHTPQKGEFYLKLDASYSCISIHPDGFRLNTKSFKGKAKAQAKADTCNMTSTLLAMGAPQFESILAMDKIVRKYFKPNHSGGKFTDSRTIEN